MMEYVLGVDIGSGSVKLTLLSHDGIIAATAGCEYPTYYPYVGWCEQDPEDWCSAFKTAFTQILQQTDIRAKQIIAISFDAATHTAVLLDENKQVIRRAILWTDQRSKAEVEEIKDTCLNLIMEQVMNAPTTVWTLPQMMWLSRHEPDVWGKIHYLLFAKDYLRFRMTGTIETDTIDAAGSMFYDVRNECWSEELCKIGGIQKQWLPRLCSPIEQVGMIGSDQAIEFGLAEGTRVLCGTTDTVMEVLAAGNVEPGHSTVKLATAGRICVVTNQPLDSKFIFNYRHVVPGLWYPGTATASCAASYRWYRDAIGKAPFAELNVPAEQIPAGSDGLMFHPYLNGELTPYNDPELKGSYIGISSIHTTAHFTKATLEGVAMSLKDCLNTLLDLGVDMKRVRIIGGGAKGMLWRQIVADVLGIEMQKVKVDDSSFGTAMLTAVGIGWFDSFAEAAQKCVQIDSISRPNPENHAIYEKLFSRYKMVQVALAPFYHEHAMD